MASVNHESLTLTSPDAASTAAPPASAYGLNEQPNLLMGGMHTATGLLTASPVVSRRPDRLADALLRLQRYEADPPLPAARPVAIETVEIAPTDLGEDRRDYPRREARGSASLVRVTADQDLTPAEADALLCLHGSAGELLDLSRNGIAIILLQPYQAGERVLVKLPLETEPQSPCRMEMAQVIRSLDMGAGLWKVVAQFEQPLSFDEAYRLCEHRLTGGYDYSPTHAAN